MHASNDKSTIKSSNKKTYATPELVLLSEVEGKGPGSKETSFTTTIGGLHIRLHPNQMAGS
jgi:hypothetical protein